jgi:N-acetylglucosaminyldiphosphoundecaprenol N-acetyl-beta-D-mannosaminyltransferase
MSAASSPAPAPVPSPAISIQTPAVPDVLTHPYPEVSMVEGIPIHGFVNPSSLFERLVRESNAARELGVQRIVHYLNIHVANSAFINPDLKRSLQEADLVYCDGAGIVVGSRWLGKPLPTRLTAADWFLDMLRYFAKAGSRVYLLGGKPGVPEQALETIIRDVPEHTVVGAHHGFILKNAEIEANVIEEINALKPDIVILGFGTPLQERWIAKHKHSLNVPMIYGIGAVMDFVSGAVPRCPAWMGERGLEWLYRLLVEPGRMAGRYIVGNPWFLARIAFQKTLFRRTSSCLEKRTLSRHLSRRK